MKKYFIIKKAAVVAGLLMILFSLIITAIYLYQNIAHIIRYIDDIPASIEKFSYIFAYVFIAPLNYLIVGLGMGGMLVLLGSMLDPEKCASFKNLKEAPPIVTNIVETEDEA